MIGLLFADTLLSSIRYWNVFNPLYLHKFGNSDGLRLNSLDPMSSRRVAMGFVAYPSCNSKFANLALTFPGVLNVAMVISVSG